MAILLGGGKIAAISKRFGYAKYRGFDSARIVRYADELSIKKEKGKVSKIKREMFVGTEETTFRKIIEAVQNMGETGATIDDLSKSVHLERHTLSKHLNRLRAEGRLCYKRIGRAKVWFVSRAPLRHIFRLSEDEKTYTEKILSHILSDIPEGVLVLDFDYNILFMNPYLIALYGDGIGQKYYHVFFDRPRESQNQCKIGEIIEGKSEEVTNQTKDKDGRILNIRARKTKNPDGSFSIIAIIGYCPANCDLYKHPI